MCTTTDKPSALNGTSKLPLIMKKKMLRMAVSSFLYMPPMRWAWGVCTFLTCPEVAAGLGHHVAALFACSRRGGM